MPILANSRYERFAQGVAKGKSQPEAYVYAGYEPSAKNLTSNAGHVARLPQVAARIQELLAKQQTRIGITVDALILELDDMLKLSKRVKHPAAGVGAILAKGKLLGLITDKVESDVTIRKPARRPTEDTEMSVEEWKAKFATDPGRDKPPGKDKLQ